MRHYQNWLKAYLQYTSHSESPTAFHFWTGVGIIGGALRRRVWIDQGTFQWTPNFYIVLVGPPGVAAKSTSIRQGIALLEQVEGINFGPQSLTWQALIESLQNAQEHVTIPGLIDPEVMSCITIAASELGTLFDPANRELIDVLVDMWDGQKSIWRRKTKSSGDTTIHNPWLNVIACTTPAWLKANFPEEMIGGGLTSRMIFVHGDKKRNLVAYPGALKAPKEHKDEGRKLAEDLKDISFIAGEYQLSAEALKWGTAWYADLWSGVSRSASIASERFDGYISRKQAHIHKLAIVLAAAKRSVRTIELEDLQEAEITVTSLEADMLKVFDSIGVNQESAKASTIVHLVRHYKEIPYKDLWRHCFATMSPQQYEEGVKAAIGAGYLTATKGPKGLILKPVEPEE